MKFLDHFEEWLISFLMAGATLLIFFAVVHRYAAGLPIPVVQDILLGLNFSWSQELCIIMFVWMAKFGAAYGVRTGIHVGVDVLVNKMSTPIRVKFIMFALFAGAFFTGTIATLGGNFIWDNGMHYAIFNLFGFDVRGIPQGPTTPDLEWPTWMVYSAIPLGSALMSFRFLQVLYAFIRTGDLPHHDHSHVEGVDTVIISEELSPQTTEDNSHPSAGAQGQPGKDTKSEGAR
jgi:C4-dicarboxylate transporter, DctQ subunit